MQRQVSTEQEKTNGDNKAAMTILSKEAGGRQKKGNEPNTEIPKYKYLPSDFVFIPFDPRESNNNRFYNLKEAMLFVARHCTAHYGKFDRKLATHYLSFCRIFDFVKGEYLSATTNLNKKTFYQSFLYAQRELRYDQ